MSSPIANRLKKNHERLKPWADKFEIEAFRLYDRDIPEYPFVIEVFGSSAVLWDRRDEKIDAGKEAHFGEAIAGLNELGWETKNIFIKKREVKDRRKEQYAPLARREIEIPVRESGHTFLVNLRDYLDCGLFLDHRLFRKTIADAVRATKSEKGACRLLNLFSYTGSISIYAAKAGAVTTSADLSKRYLEWSERNFIANGLLTANHRFIEEDVLDWIKSGRASKTGPYDITVCDPPTFSNSKKMIGTFDVERDHLWLIEQLLSLTRPGGTVYFSTNKRGFSPDSRMADLPSVESVRDISKETLPKDFHDSKIRRAYKIVKRSQNS